MGRDDEHDGLDARDAARGAFRREGRIDATDDSWHGGTTPMRALSRDEDTSDAPTVISGDLDDLPNLEEVFPERKPAVPAPDATEPAPAPVVETEPTTWWLFDLASVIAGLALLVAVRALVAMWRDGA